MRRLSGSSHVVQMEMASSAYQDKQERSYIKRADLELQRQAAQMEKLQLDRPPQAPAAKGAV
eukprot:jgi/Astpho2/7347/Aster-01942